MQSQSKPASLSVHPATSVHEPPEVVVVEEHCSQEAADKPEHALSSCTVALES